MKTGIISDVHGNLEALEAVMQRLGEIEVERIVCLGDVVGYGADPVACLDSVKSRCEFVLAGNHDLAVSGAESTNSFNPWATEAVIWTQTQLTGEWMEYLSSLEYTHEEKSAVYAHASPHKPELWRYINSPADAMHEFRYLKKRVAFVGHSHLPGIYRSDGEELIGTVTLHSGARYIVNIGSVGQPRDGNPAASFGVYDDDEKTVAIERLRYDVETAAEKIIAAGLPSHLAKRLALGV